MANRESEEGIESVRLSATKVKKKILIPLENQEDVTDTKLAIPVEPPMSPFSQSPSKPIPPPFRPVERICVIIGNSDYSILRAQPNFHKFCDLPEVKADVKNFYREIKKYNFGLFDVHKVKNRNYDQIKKMMDSI